MAYVGPMVCPDHSINLLSDSKLTYICSGCKMKGKGDCYSCVKCKYVLHSQCMYPSNKITTSFLKGYEFEFMNKPLPPPRSCGKRYCDACGMAVKGNVYHCYKSGFDLHPCCAGLQTNLEMDGQKLTLYKENVHEECSLCSSKSNNKRNRIDYGWFYASQSEDYRCHVFCIMNIYANEGENSLTLAKLESLPIMKRRKGGGDRNKYWKILKAIITYVIAIVFGDPTTIVARLLVDGVVYLIQGD